jgi:hypothetical protein
MSKITAKFDTNEVTKTRKAWIKELLNDVVMHCQDDGCYADNTVNDFYLYGFKGIENMTDAELLDEIQNILEYKYHPQGND